MFMRNAIQPGRRVNVYYYARERRPAWQTQQNLYDILPTETIPEFRHTFTARDYVTGPTAGPNYSTTLLRYRRVPGGVTDDLPATANGCETAATVRDYITIILLLILLYLYHHDSGILLPV